MDNYENDQDVTDEMFDGDENEFLEFVSRLSANNSHRRIREQIERLEESRRLSDALGLDGFELGQNY